MSTSGKRLVFSNHALRRMARRGIGVQDIRHVLMHGRVIEEYPTDTPYPSRLLLGWVASRPLHIVAADNAHADETIIITVYEPDPLLWHDDFRQRR